MQEVDHTIQARTMVTDYFNDHRHDGPDAPPPKLVVADTCVTWFSITGKNWRALVITDGEKDACYFVSYDASTGRRRLDVYKLADSVDLNDRIFGIAPHAAS